MTLDSCFNPFVVEDTARRAIFETSRGDVPPSFKRTAPEYVHSTTVLYVARSRESVLAPVDEERSACTAKASGVAVTTEKRRAK